MALKDEWVDKVNGVDDVNAEDINSIAQAVIAMENGSISEELTNAIINALPSAEGVGF